jgi:hypothetical protein
MAEVNQLDFHHLICPTNLAFQPYISLERVAALLQSADITS